MKKQIEEYSRLSDKSDVELGHCQIIDVSKIKHSPFNMRKLTKEPVDSDDFVELCNSIRQDGLVEPIIVRPIPGDGFEAVAGGRRLQALKHIGAPHASTIVRNMSDNDARIASLVENILRKDGSREEKIETIKEIYANANPAWKDQELVESYLSTLARRKERERKGARSGLTKTRSVEIPDEFEELSKRIGYSPGYQYAMLHYGIESRPASEINYLAEIEEKQRALIEQHPFLKKQPLLKQDIASDVRDRGLDLTQTKNYVNQYVHDFKTGARYVDTDDGDIRYRPTRYEQIEEHPRTEQNNAVRMRGDVMYHGEQLFEAMTGASLSDEDVKMSERTAGSKQARDNMKAICTTHLQMRELRALQDLVIPLKIALKHFEDEIDKADG